MDILKKETYVQVTGYIFLAVGIFHGLRAFNEWGLVYNGWVVPLWVSWIAAVGTLYLAYNAFHLKK
ncbi:MAG: hypothetical protein WD153_03410 [Candidatus Paceibacterota bacterium]